MHIVFFIPHNIITFVIGFSRNWLSIFIALVSHPLL